MEDLLFETATRSAFGDRSNLEFRPPPVSESGELRVARAAFQLVAHLIQ
jgi:hypothetical protein